MSLKSENAERSSSIPFIFVSSILLFFILVYFFYSADKNVGEFGHGIRSSIPSKNNGKNNGIGMHRERGENAASNIVMEELALLNEKIWQRFQQPGNKVFLFF
jgi:hypothetical protein